MSTYKNTTETQREAVLKAAKWSYVNGDPLHRFSLDLNTGFHLNSICALQETA